MYLELFLNETSSTHNFQLIGMIATHGEILKKRKSVSNRRRTRQRWEGFLLCPTFPVIAAGLLPVINENDISFDMQTFDR